MDLDLFPIAGLVVGLVSLVLTIYYRFYYYKGSSASAEEEKFIIEFITTLRESLINTTHFLLEKNSKKDIVFSTQYNFFSYVNTKPFSIRLEKKALDLPIILDERMFRRNLIKYYDNPYMPENLLEILQILDFKPLNPDRPFSKEEILSRRNGFVLVDDQFILNIVLGIGLCSHKYMVVKESNYFYIDCLGKPLTLFQMNVLLKTLDKRIRKWLKNRKLFHLYKDEIRQTKHVKGSLRILRSAFRRIKNIDGAEIMKADRRIIES